MVILILTVLGLCMGSFVNALVWRVHEQSQGRQLSILKGRSMCPRCGHRLAAADLAPVLSWLALKGRCRYCGRRISAQYPLVEAATAALFVASYVWWPQALGGAQTAVFVLWLVLLTGLMALLVYDARWRLLPNRILSPLWAVAGAQTLIAAMAADEPLRTLLAALGGVAVGGGIFYGLFEVSKGRWIGGGDVKLGALLGLVVATPARAGLFIFLGSLLGTLVSLPMLTSGRLKRSSIIPFGPFLIAAAIITVLFGGHILDWYQGLILP